MAFPQVLGQLVIRCSQRFGGEGASLLDPTEIKGLIAEYYGEMHAIVVEKGARYFEAEATIDLNNLALPADHLATVGVDAVINGTTGPRRPVYGPIMTQERSRLIGATGPASYFAIEGASLALYPLPTTGTYKHLYVPQPTDYSSASDFATIDVVNIYGLRFILWGVASVALHKEQTSQQRAVDEAKAARDQLEFWACQRALTQPSYRVPQDPWSPTTDLARNGMLTAILR